ncbi:hypothetical protein GCM10010106_08530 [Thermopolyspora flexuosa]|uniref:Uncharacterized protein n=1 Tax=Thermopolyspora flexuosa TaxID=103836 RepID=A0A543IZX5_9ACTN|nr:hypothetical protein [Thermopolyspora flexuosa]TQM76122.1 hypothetical protein FHX40_2847 [Thermopolyspora flexuosa]GGM64895.1 hypothetical protein GCM10010106_08530 [Thermopolyspora flexuosa]
MTRRPPRRAVPLCVLLSGLLAGTLLRPTSAAHALVIPGADPDAAPPTAAAGDRTPPSASARLRVDGSLSDIVALGPQNVWAVGQEGVWDDWQSRGVITHWDGSSWNAVGIRNDASGAGRLRSVAAASPTELWAVGEGHDSRPYVVRGDGSTFDRIDVATLRAGDWLGGVAAVPGRVVTVGSRDGHPMIATGASGRWSVVTRKARGTLYGVALLSAKDGWAVGETTSGPLVLRLSGGKWKQVRVPRVKGGFLRDVHADGPKRVVAIGGVYRSSGAIHPLALRWNGKRWTRMRVPDRPAELYGVTGDAAGRFWAAGFDPARPGEPFLLRYADGRWRTERGRKAGAGRTVRLLAVTHVTGLTMAVGHVVDGSGRYTDLIETVQGDERT